MAGQNIGAQPRSFETPEGAVRVKGYDFVPQLEQGESKRDNTLVFKPVIGKYIFWGGQPMSKPEIRKRVNLAINRGELPA